MRSGAIPRAIAFVCNTTFPTEDLIIAQFNVRESPYHAKGDGVTDDTVSFQKAIDDAAALGGAVVFVPTGVYRFNGTLRLKSGVTLRGEWVNPKTNGGKVEGTILAVYAGRGDEKATPFLTLEKVSSLRDVSVWYPEQKANSIVPYPWTIDLGDPLGHCPTVCEVTFVNSYQAISNGAIDGKVYNMTHYRDLYGTPLKHGLWIEALSDWTDVERVSFGPRYWKESGLPGAPSDQLSETDLRRWLFNEGTGLTIRRGDWPALYDIHLDGYGIGIHLTEKPGPPHAFASNGSMYGINVEGGRIGLEADGIGHPGWLISRSSFTSANVPGAIAVELNNAQVNCPLQFNTCVIGSLSMPEINHGAVSLENCKIEGPLDIESGIVSLVNNQFTDTGVILGKGVEKAVLAGNRFMKESNAIEAKNPRIIKKNPAPSVVEVSNKPYAFPPVRRPATNRLFNVREYGAQGDQKSNDTEAFQKVLSAAARAGGGTVYVPAGQYLITDTLTVPTGVELRGIFEGPPHTMVVGSCLLTKMGHGQEQGLPFIRLSASSGIRGLNIWYPQQDYRKLSPYPYPWTIQALGRGCWVKDVCLGNSWQGVDFATALDTGGHFIQGLRGTVLRRGLVVGHSTGTGYVENPYFDHSFWVGADPRLPGVRTPTLQDPVFHHFVHKNLDAYQFGDCGEEYLMDSAVFLARTGLWVNGDFHGIVYQHDSDGCMVGLRISGHPDATFINTNSAVHIDPPEKTDAFLFDDQFIGHIRLLNNSFWGPGGEGYRVLGSGQIVFSQLNVQFLTGVVVNPNTDLRGVLGWKNHQVDWLAGRQPNPLICFFGCEVQDKEIPVIDEQKGNLSRFISQNVPDRVSRGQLFSVSATFQNVGTTMWTRESKYNLGFPDGRDNNIWHTGRAMPFEGAVRPGDKAIFTFKLKAPQKPGTYDFRCRMVQEGKEWFGEFSPLVSIIVDGGSNSNKH